MLDVLANVINRFRSLSLTSTLSALVYAYLIIVVAIRYAVTELRHNISRGLQGVLNKVWEDEKLRVLEPTNEFFTQFPVMTLAFCVRTLFLSDFFDRSRTRTNANLARTQQPNTEKNNAHSTNIHCMQNLVS